MTEQKFHKGDWIKVDKDLGPMMSHFTSDCEAIVIGSYADEYGGNDRKSYTLHIKGKGRASWYEEHQLTLIESGRIALLEKWEQEEKEEIELKSDIDWIFSNSKEVLEKPHGASLQTLFNCFAEGSLWGSNGEGINYYSNSMITLNLATPFLESSNKEEWLKLCEKIKKPQSGD